MSSNIPSAAPPATALAEHFDSWDPLSMYIQLALEVEGFSHSLERAHGMACLLM